MLFLTFDTEGERDAFLCVYERYKGLMLYKAREILKDNMLAEDAVSEAFLRIYKNMHKIDDPASKRTAAFVMIIVRNVSLTMLKKKSVLVEDWYDAPDSFDMEESVLAADSARHIISLLDACGEESKSVFLLKYAYGLSHRDIAKTLNMSENNVTVRLHRVRKRLCAIMQEGGCAHEYV